MKYQVMIMGILDLTEDEKDIVDLLLDETAGEIRAEVAIQELRDLGKDIKVFFSPAVKGLKGD